MNVIDNENIIVIKYFIFDFKLIFIRTADSIEIIKNKIKIEESEILLAIDGNPFIMPL